MTVPRERCVGPVLDPGELADAVIQAIRARHPDAVIEDRGSYLRVLVPERCVVERHAVETHLGRAVRFPGDLERILPSFKGRFRLNEDEASWTAEDRAPPEGR